MRDIEPRIETLRTKKLIGKRIRMSLSINKTADLWRSFMPVRKEIQNVLGSELYSVRVYESSYFSNFNPNTEFEKWATMEVDTFDSVPAEMETLVLEGGLYAVFIHKGSNTDTSTFQYIYGTWLPHSKYLLDERPHFEILGDKYKNGDPSSEEEIWVPVKAKIS